MAALIELTDIARYYQMGDERIAALDGVPSLLLCDEPTGNLDSATTEDILELFRQLHAEGNTIIIVTHEPEIAARCPRAIRIFDGKIVADGQGRDIASSRKGAA